MLHVSAEGFLMGAGVVLRREGWFFFPSERAVHFAIESCMAVIHAFFSLSVKVHRMNDFCGHRHSKQRSRNCDSCVPNIFVCFNIVGSLTAADTDTVSKGSS